MSKNSVGKTFVLQEITSLTRLCTRRCPACLSLHFECRLNNAIIIFPTVTDSQAVS